MSVDDRRLGELDSSQLKAGHRFPLADGSPLDVKLVELPLPELRVSHGGVPVPGSPEDPKTRVAQASRLILVLGVLGALAGLVTVALDLGVLRGAGLGGASVVLGLAFAALGIPACRGSVLAFALAVVVYVVDGLSGFALRPEGVAPPVGSFLVRLLFLVPLVRGALAARSLDEGPAYRRKAPPVSSVTRPPAGHEPEPVKSLAPAVDARRRELAVGAAAAGATVARGRERAVASLRFVAPKCELIAGGLRVVGAAGKHRDIPWRELSAIGARRLPPDPPWDGKPILDFTATTGDPVRIVATTIVNFAPLPGGAAPSRLENLRQLVRLALREHPGVTLDDETRAFAEGNGQPVQLGTVAAFAEYDLRHGQG